MTARDFVWPPSIFPRKPKPPVPIPGTPRRSVLAAVPALAMFGASAATGRSVATKQDNDTPATTADFAGFRFSDEGPAVSDAFGTRDDWLQRAGDDYAAFAVAGGISRRDQDQMAEIVSKLSPDNALEVFHELCDLQAKYTALAGVLETASLRLMSGICCHGHAAGIIDG